MDAGHGTRSDGGPPSRLSVAFPLCQRLPRHCHIFFSFFVFFLFFFLAFDPRTTEQRKRYQSVLHVAAFEYIDPDLAGAHFLQQILFGSTWQGRGCRPTAASFWQLGSIVSSPACNGSLYCSTAAPTQPNNRLHTETGDRGRSECRVPGPFHKKTRRTCPPSAHHTHNPSRMALRKSLKARLQFVELWVRWAGSGSCPREPMREPMRSIHK
ncbi:hypothetical protein GE21DRAFT_1039593 [Neurospora crassa]|nr:hypothetical protein GE21DRAFT_1039593 [Neurospora crassa]